DPAGLLNRGRNWFLGENHQGFWVYVATVGLVYFKDGAFHRLKVPAEIEPWLSRQYLNFLVDEDGGIWVGSNGLLGWFRGDSVKIWTTQDGLSPAPILKLFRDREGSVWIGYDGTGVGRMVNGRISSFPPGDSLSRGLIRMFCEDREGNLWIGRTSE